MNVYILYYMKLGSFCKLNEPAFVFRPKHSSTSSNKIVLISTLSEQTSEEYQREE